MDIKNIYYFFKAFKKNQGFTLIELLVVIMIVGTLFGLSLPNLLSQIGKSRETEAKSNLGAMARAQQAYHFEHKVFADSLNKLESNFTYTEQYYTYPIPDIANNSLLKQRAISINSNLNRTKNYALGIYFNAGSYQFNLCQSRQIGAPVEAPNAAEASCTHSGIKIN